MEENGKLVKIANHILDALIKLRKGQYQELLNSNSKLTDRISECNSDSRKLAKALDNGWLLAAKKLRTRLSRIICELSTCVQKNKQIIDLTDKSVPKLSALIDDLMQLERDCGPIDFNNEENAIAVVTESIELEGVCFGPFRIELHITKLMDISRDRPYFCIALEPNPASTGDDVTHPHVCKDTLCEGDGSAGIRAALEQGRICDFFTMVVSILNTYNPDSPYVSLYDWEGIPCYDCGCSISGDDMYFCPFCNYDYCDQCSTYCRLCDEATCLGCAGECFVCGLIVCSNCVEKCSECGEMVCTECIEENICSICREEREAENEEQEDSETEKEEREDRGENDPESQREQQVGTEIQSHCLGKTALLPGQIRQ